MKMVIKVGHKTLNIKGSKKVREILKELDLNPEAHLVVVNGKLATEDETVDEDATVKIVKVVSGG